VEVLFELSEEIVEALELPLFIVRKVFL